MVGYFTQVPDGRAYIIQVADISQAPLPDDDLAALINWTLYKFSKDQLATHFKLYTEKEVKKLRNTRPADLHSVRRKLLVSLKQRGIQLPKYVRP